MRKKTIVIIFIAFLVIVAISIVTGYPLIIDLSKPIKMTARYQKGAFISPLKEMDFDKGKWSAYLFLNGEEKSELSSLPIGRCFKTNDSKILKGMQKEWHFKYTGGDIATAESELLLCHDGKVVFRSGIVLAGKQGLQNHLFGWVEATEYNILSKYCEQFDKSLSPIIFLR